MTTRPTTDSRNDSLPPTVAAQLLDRMPVGILIQQGLRVVWINDALLRQIDSDREEWSTADAAAATSRFSPLFGSEDDVWITHRNGERRCLRRLVCNLAEAAYRVSIYLDVSREADLENAVKSLTERMESLEMRDPETGLLNRLAVLAALDRQITRSRRYGNPLSILRLTLQPPDHATNAPDIILELSQEFRAQLRWADEMGRLDQTRFLLVLSETSEDHAGQLAEKLRRDPAAVARSVEGWTVAYAAAAWQKGDDRRRLLARVGVEA